MNLNNKLPLSRTDKLCSAALAGVLIATVLVYELTDSAALRRAQRQVDKPPVETIAITSPIDCTLLVEAVETIRAERYGETIPLSQELQFVLREACEASGVPVPLALGLIEVESNFQPDAVSSEGAYGLCQLNPRYFPQNLSPADNLAAGVAYLGELLDRYENPAVALTVYNAGSDTGSRTYAEAVLAAAEKWRKS